MIIHTMTQRTPEWFEARKGKISGTRLGQLISNRKNRMVYELLNEQLSDYLFPDDYISDDMQFGIDNEPIARDMYALQTGIEWQEIGLIQSSLLPMHVASPDGISPDSTAVLEIKCTRSGDIHLQRFFEGVESGYMPQIYNYFAVADEIKEVHWVSYCPERAERPLIVYVFKRENYEDIVAAAREKISMIELQLNNMKSQFLF